MPAPKPVLVEEVKLNPKQPHIFLQQKVLQPKIEKVEVKAPESDADSGDSKRKFDRSTEPTEAAA